MKSVVKWFTESYYSAFEVGVFIAAVLNLPQTGLGMIYFILIMFAARAVNSVFLTWSKN